MLESYFKSEKEKEFVQREISQIRLANFVLDVIRANETYPCSYIDAFTWDNVENLLEPIEYTKDDYKEWLKDNDGLEYLDEYEPNLTYAGETNNENFQQFLDELEDDREFRDIFQVFMVDNYQYEKLKQIGEPVLFAGGNYFWGRTCCGQAIELDGTFQKIYRMIEK